MIINIKNKKDLITLDFRLKEIRYLSNYEDKTRVIFDSIKLSNNDIEGFDYLFKNDKNLFFKTLKETLLNLSGIKIKIKDLEVLKWEN